MCPAVPPFLKGVSLPYSNDCKADLLGVPEDVLKKFGAVSEKTAVSMRGGRKKTRKMQSRISTTGIAGPAGGTTEKPVGTVLSPLQMEQQHSAGITTSGGTGGETRR